jgi:hypothetical protein
VKPYEVLTELCGATGVKRKRNGLRKGLSAIAAPSPATLSKSRMKRTAGVSGAVVWADAFEAEILAGG